MSELVAPPGDDPLSGVAQPSVIKQSFAVGCVLTALVAAALVSGGHRGWAIGFSAGAGISLLSLLSLGLLIPEVLMPNAPGVSQFLLALSLFIKMPLYALALYAVSRMPGVDIRSAFPGVLVAPLIVGVRTLAVSVAALKRAAR